MNKFSDFCFFKRSQLFKLMTNLGLPAAKVRIFSLAKGVFVQIFYDGDRGWGMGDGVGHACDAGIGER